MRPVAVAAAFLPLLLLATGCTIEVEEEDAASATLQTAAERMLEASAFAWNRGDLDAVLDDYVESATTTLTGPRGTVSGVDAIRARYAPLFEPDVVRDSLRVEDVQTRRLGAIYGLVTGRRILGREGVVAGSSPFTLVVRRVGGGWRIIHDHGALDPQRPGPPVSVPADSPSPSPPGGGPRAEE